MPRMQVLEILRASPHRHLSVDAIYRRVLDRGLDMGLATVYRVLSQLEAVGILSRNMFGGGKAVFEINEGSHYDHLICLRCGHVQEFQNEAIEALQREVAHRAMAMNWQIIDWNCMAYVWRVAQSTRALRNT